jgi:hypothetical protein
MSMPPSVGGASGGGAISGGGPPPTTTTAAPSVPTGDVATALAALSDALQRLAGVLNAMSGAAQVQGGGAASGCGCAGGSSGGGGGGGGDSGLTGGGFYSPMQVPLGAKGAPEAAPVGGDTRSRIVELARAELAKGVREDNGRDDDKAGNIRRYRTAVTGPGENPNAAEAWCADFASWILKTAGVPFGQGGRGEDYTPEMVKWAQSKGSWKTDDPKPGDLVMIDWKGGRGSSDPASLVDHVAIVERVENGRVYTIGGNEKNALRAADYSLDDKRFLGFIKPAGT